MSLRITRLERNPQRHTTNMSASSVWSACDLCPPDLVNIEHNIAVNQSAAEQHGPA